MFPLGHFGVALLATAWLALVRSARVTTGVTVVALFAAWLPDADRLLPHATHHGLTHTLGFAAGLAVAGGGVAAAGALLARASISSVPRVQPRRVAGYCALGLFLGTGTHVLGDVVMLLPGPQPVSPLWPLSGAAVRIEVLPYGVVARNVGLFVGGLAAHAVTVWYRTA